MLLKTFHWERMILVCPMHFQPKSQNDLSDTQSNIKVKRKWKIVSFRMAATTAALMVAWGFVRGRWWWMPFATAVAAVTATVAAWFRWGFVWWTGAWFGRTFVGRGWWRRRWWGATSTSTEASKCCRFSSRCRGTDLRLFLFQTLCAIPIWTSQLLYRWVVTVLVVELLTWVAFHQLIADTNIELTTHHAWQFSKVHTETVLQISRGWATWFIRHSNRGRWRVQLWTLWITRLSPRLLNGNLGRQLHANSVFIAQSIVQHCP